MECKVNYECKMWSVKKSPVIGGEESGGEDETRRGVEELRVEETRREEEETM